ncbi:hypothetical protein D9M71_146060 [compost metagenome]
MGLQATRMSLGLELVLQQRLALEQQGVQALGRYPHRRRVRRERLHNRRQLRRQLDRIAFGGGFQALDQALLVMLIQGLAAMQPLHGLEGMAAQLDTFRRQVQTPVAHRRQQALPGMAELFDGRYPGGARGALEAVHLAEQRLDGVHRSRGPAPIGQAIGQHAEALFRLSAEARQQALSEGFPIQAQGDLTT